MIDSRHPNTSVITTEADQLITVTTKTGVTIKSSKGFYFDLNCKTDQSGSTYPAHVA